MQVGDESRPKDNNHFGEKNFGNDEREIEEKLKGSESATELETNNSEIFKIEKDSASNEESKDIVIEIPSDSDSDDDGETITKHTLKENSEHETSEENLTFKSKIHRRRFDRKDFKKIKKPPHRIAEKIECSIGVENREEINKTNDEENLNTKYPDLPNSPSKLTITISRTDSLIKEKSKIIETSYFSSQSTLQNLSFSSLKSQNTIYGNNSCYTLKNVDGGISNISSPILQPTVQNKDILKLALAQIMNTDTENPNTITSFLSSQGSFASKGSSINGSFSSRSQQASTNPSSIIHSGDVSFDKVDDEFISKQTDGEIVLNELANSLEKHEIEVDSKLNLIEHPLATKITNGALILSGDCSKQTLVNIKIQDDKVQTDNQSLLRTSTYEDMEIARVNSSIETVGSLLSNFTDELINSTVLDMYDSVAQLSSNEPSTEDEGRQDEAALESSNISRTVLSLEIEGSKSSQSSAKISNNSKDEIKSIKEIINDYSTHKDSNKFILVQNETPNLLWRCHHDSIDSRPNTFYPRHFESPEYHVKYLQLPNEETIRNLINEREELKQMNVTDIQEKILTYLETAVKKIEDSIVDTIKSEIKCQMVLLQGSKVEHVTKTTETIDNTCRKESPSETQYQQTIKSKKINEIIRSLGNLTSEMQSREIAAKIFKDAQVMKPSIEMRPPKYKHLAKIISEHKGSVSLSILDTELEEPTVSYTKRERKNKNNLRTFAFLKENFMIFSWVPAFFIGACTVYVFIALVTK